MSLWSSETTLEQIKKIIDDNLFGDHHGESQCGSIHILDAVQISKEETLILASKFSAFNSQEMFREYCICVIVAWAYAFRHNIDEYFKQNMMQRYTRIPQHALGIYLKTYRNTFDEYGLDTFETGFTSLSAIEHMIRLHGTYHKN